MKKLTIALLFLAGLTYASSTRVVNVDQFKSSDNLKTWNPPATSDTLAGIAATQTLTNKSISGATNTFSLIPTAAVVGLSGTNSGDVTLGTASGLSLLGQVLSLQLSDATHTGALSSTDWNTFNSKQAPLTYGSISSSTTGVTVGSGANSTVGPNVTVDVQTASTSQPGLLSAADWNTFNNKVSATRAINTTSPLVGGGDLSADRTISIPVATTSVNGYLSSVDWTTFNNKQPAGNYITALTGDVSATGPGSVAATVNSVGTSSAANVHSAELLANAATSLNTANAIVKRDASGNFSAGSITASLNGNANSASSFSGALLGDVTGSQTATVVSLVGGKSAASVATSVNDTQAATNSNTASTIVKRDGSGNFSAGTITANLVGTSTNVTGTVAVANGGTGATTAAAARVNIGADQRSSFSNSNYTVLSTDRYVAQTGTMSAVRTVTLPLASSVNAGQILVIQDESGTVDTTNSISISASGADTINGSATKTIRTAYGFSYLTSNGTNAWTRPVEGIGSGGTGLSATPTDGQLLIGKTSTNSYNQTTLTAGAGIGITNGSGTITIANTAASQFILSSGITGDGIEGDITYSSNTTLTRDIYAHNITVNSAVDLNTGGFSIFASGTITIQATGRIIRIGNAGGNSATTAGGAAGAALAGTTVGTSGAGGAGAAGGSFGNGASGSNGAAVSGEGGAGGVGGNAGQGAGGATTGGSGGNGGVLTIRYFRNVQPDWKHTAVGTYMPTGTGGGGGAGGGGDNVSVAGRGGGGGGGGGGAILIICDTFNNSGTVSVKGGAGGNGGAGATSNAGGGAGGGGGSGGKIMLLANTITAAGTLDVSGGAAGTGSSGAGTGTAGSNGAAGGNGYATRYEASTQTWTTTQ